MWLIEMRDVLHHQMASVRVTLGVFGAVWFLWGWPKCRLTSLITGFTSAGSLVTLQMLHGGIQTFFFHTFHTHKRPRGPVRDVRDPLTWHWRCICSLAGAKPSPPWGATSMILMQTWSELTGVILLSKKKRAGQKEDTATLLLYKRWSALFAFINHKQMFTWNINRACPEELLVRIRGVFVGAGGAAL